MRAAERDWCILQMAGPRTLAVVRSLKAAGFDVWAPTGMTRRKRPRSDKYRDEPAVLLTCIAFARFGDAPRLAALVQAPVQEHPAFSLLMHRGTYGGVPDSALAGLRELETDKAAEWADFVAAEEASRLEKIRKRKRRRKGKGRLNTARSYVLGQTVRVEDPAFHGLTAKVIENRKNGDIIIELGGGLMQMQVEACEIRPVHVMDAQPEQATVT